MGRGRVPQGECRSKLCHFFFFYVSHKEHLGPCCVDVSILQILEYQKLQFHEPCQVSWLLIDH